MKNRFNYRSLQIPDYSLGQTLRYWKMKRKNVLDGCPEAVCRYADRLVGRWEDVGI